MMSGKANAQGVAPRLAATQLLHAVLFERRLLSDVVSGSRSPLARLNPAERARAQSLAVGVLRNLAGLDEVLDRFLEKPTPPKVRNTLRLAAYELLVDGGAAHGVVNAAVEIVRGSARAGRLAGLVNAVARRLADQGPAIWRGVARPQPLPLWLAKPVVRYYGKEALAGIEEAHAAGASIDLTVKNPEESDHWAEVLDARILPNGSLRLPERVQVSALPGYIEGAWWVQDAAAAIPARLLGDVAGKRVLDLCAAPGGKTLQLAAAGARVTALDVSTRRMERLGRNLARTALRAEIVIADALAWKPAHGFDAILLDAPCSATGTIRRHPDLPFVKRGADLSGLFALQADLIDAAVGMLGPGGKMVYCTCSLLPREGEDQIRQALDRHPDLHVAAPDSLPGGILPGWRSSEGGWRLRPDFWAALGGMDGFYMAVLERRSGSGEPAGENCRSVH